MGDDDWLGERAVVLADRLAARGVRTDVLQARRLVARRVMDTARARRISSIDACAFLTDTVLDQMAEWFAEDFGERTADDDEPPTVSLVGVAHVSVTLVGRAVAALAEVLQAGPSREVLELIHTLGVAVAETRETDRVAVPHATLSAAALHLDAAAARLAESGHPSSGEADGAESDGAEADGTEAAGTEAAGETAATWRREAMRLRGAVR